MKIAELLHFCLTAKRSGVIQLNHSSEDARIYIRDGEVIAAEYQDLPGEEAFFALLLLDDPNNEFIEKPVTEPSSIRKSTHFLLMEAARLADEAGKQTAEPDPSDTAETADYCLNFITLDNAKFALQHNSVTIGRDQSCDITVPDVSVSGSHCRILWNGKEHLLSDIGSSNGTYLNDEWIQNSRALATGDRIQVGLCHFSYEKIQPDDQLVDPQRVVPFTFGSETQKIELPPQHQAGAGKFASEATFKDYQPVEEKRKKIHIWPFGKDS